jgi:hypothetical protein
MGDSDMGWIARGLAAAFFTVALAISATQAADCSKMQARVTAEKKAVAELDQARAQHIAGKSSDIELCSAAIKAEEALEDLQDNLIAACLQENRETVYESLDKIILAAAKDQGQWCPNRK